MGEIAHLPINITDQMIGNFGADKVLIPLDCLGNDFFFTCCCNHCFSDTAMIYDFNAIDRSEEISRNPSDARYD